MRKAYAGYKQVRVMDHPTRPRATASAVILTCVSFMVTPSVNSYSLRPDICGSHCCGMPLTATGVGGPQWRTKRTINHHVAVVLDHKESFGSPSSGPPHR